MTVDERSEEDPLRVGEGVTLETVTEVAEPSGEAFAGTVEHVDQRESREYYSRSSRLYSYSVPRRMTHF